MKNKTISFHDVRIIRENNVFTLSVCSKSNLDGFLPTANKFVLSTRSHIDVSGNAPVRLKYKLKYFC